MYLLSGSAIFYAKGKEDRDVTKFNPVNPRGATTAASWADHTA